MGICLDYDYSCASVVHIPPRLRVSFFFVYFVFFVVPPLYFVVPFVSIRVHSWFILSPPPFFFRAFRVFRGSTPVFRGSIRVHSCPFVSIRVHSWFILSPLPSFFVYFVFFVVPLLYFVVPFVSIRGSNSLPCFLFSCLSCFSWFHSCISWFHSWLRALASGSFFATGGGLRLFAVRLY